jgi:hypothetical protein
MELLPFLGEKGIFLQEKNQESLAILAFARYKPPQFTYGVGRNGLSGHSFPAGGMNGSSSQTP